MEDLKKELEEAKAKIAEIEKKLAQKESGVWKLEEGDTYWSIVDDGAIVSHGWDNDNFDNKVYTIGNCFLTRTEAEFALEKLKVIAELKRYAEPKDREWGGDNFHYFIHYNFGIEKVVIDFYKICRISTIFFESEAKALEAIEAVGEDRIKKYYLEVE